MLYAKDVGRMKDLAKQTGEKWLCLCVILHLFVMKSDREEAYLQSLGADCKFECCTGHIAHLLLNTDRREVLVAGSRRTDI